MAARTSSRWSVALRKESVDRNVAYLATSARLTVALRKESVDRNIADYAKPEWLRVALRKESVDRNRPGVPIPGPGGRSLSARRAWIEMPFCRRGYRRELSLSARRAWIEIAAVWAALAALSVALRKESVDRNFVQLGGKLAHGRRSPQGERG